MKKNLPFHGHKTLLEAMEIAETSSFEAKKYLQDNRLSNPEKKIISYIILLRSNDFSFIQELKDNSSFDSICFLKGLKHFLLGTVYTYLGNTKEAEEQLTISLPYLHECQSERFVKRMIFKLHENLFYTYVNQKRPKEMELVFKKTELLEKVGTAELSFKIMRLCFYSMTERYSEAEDLLEEVRKVKDQLNDIQLISYLMEEFDLYVKLELFGKAENTLEEMKKHRTFRLTTTSNYSSKLLKYLTKNEKIYAYDRDFAGSRNLFLMMKVICALDEGNKTEASVYWNELSELSPTTYQKDFVFNGDKCLFSLCLDKCLNSNKKVEVQLTGKYTKQEQAFIDIFMERGSDPLKKEDLFKMVYGKEFESKDDLVALAMLVFRINKKKELLFKSKKGTFYLVETKKKTA